MMSLIFLDNVNQTLVSAAIHIAGRMSASAFSHYFPDQLKVIGKRHRRSYFFAFRPESDFRETPSRFAACATFLGVRCISAATAWTDFNDAASCIKRRSSA
jgi:hypothetical protein